jgi:hypothetical protein
MASFLRELYKYPSLPMALNSLPLHSLSAKAHLFHLLSQTYKPLDISLQVLDLEIE